MNTVDLYFYFPMDKQYPFLKNIQSGIDKVNRAIQFHDQIEYSCRFLTSFFQEYGWSGLDKFLNDVHFKIYGADPDGMDPTVTRKTVLNDLSHHAGLALSQWHCLTEIFSEEALPLYVNEALNAREVLVLYYLTTDAAPVFELPLPTLSNVSCYPGLLYVLCAGESRLAKNPLVDQLIESPPNDTLHGLGDLITRESIGHGSRESFLAKVYSNRYGMRSETRIDAKANAWKDVVNVYARILGNLPANDRLDMLERHPFIPTEITNKFQCVEQMENPNFSLDEANLFSAMLTANPGKYLHGQFIEALLKRIERMTASDYWSPELFESFMRTLNESEFPLTQWVMASLFDPDCRHSTKRDFEVSVMTKAEAITELVCECLLGEINERPLSFNMSRRSKQLLLEYALKIQDRIVLEHAASPFASDYGIDEVFAVLDKYCGDGFFAAKVKKPGLLRDNLSQQLGL